tara:strand:+ start:1554 stop:2225 length:672 start_codon:yes stop_codon:yes gene_type:complete
VGVFCVIACNAPNNLDPTDEPVDSLIERSAKQMTQLSSLTFSLHHEEGFTELMPSILLRDLNGEIQINHGFNLNIKGESTLFRSFIEMKITGIGDKTYLTNPITGNWELLEKPLLPFNFSDLGDSLSGILLAFDNSNSSKDRVNSESTGHKFTGTIMTDALATLIPSATPMLEVEIDIWISPTSNLIEKIRLSGPIIPSDKDPVIRILRFRSFDKPVSIMAPL